MSKEIEPGVLLDITTLVTLTSDICLDLDGVIKIFGDLDGWKWASEDTMRQLKDEKDDPVYKKIINKINGQKWYVCNTAFEKWKDMMSKSGSKTEKERVDKLIKKLTVIDDDVPEFMQWMDGRIWTDSSRLVFGTAYNNCDKLVLVTANKKAAMSLYEFGYDQLNFIVHRSRKYIGDKYDDIRDIKKPDNINVGSK